MASMFLKRNMTLTSVLSSHFRRRDCCLSSWTSKIGHKDIESPKVAPFNDPQKYSSEFRLSPLFLNAKPQSGAYDIELVDLDTWRASSGLAHAWKGNFAGLETRTTMEKEIDEPCNDHLSPMVSDTDFDAIEDMRIRGNLFYKLDRGSKEFEEYDYQFRSKRSSRNKIDLKESKNEAQNAPKAEKNKLGTSQIIPVIKSFVEEKKKKIRTLTYNQLTGPYHEPFCLDIYISKGSVRACIIHRATSNVVAVAHSISKDMKHDLGSVRDSKACVAVGSILAQRALADDIHDAIYSPRKGERLEGKLQLVLQAVINNGVNVKVKIKKRTTKFGRPITS